MDELIDLVVKRTNISKEQAEKVVDTVIGYLEDKLPDPLGSNLRKLIGDEKTVDTLDNTAETLSKGLGDWLQSRKEK